MNAILHAMANASCSSSEYKALWLVGWLARWDTTCLAASLVCVHLFIHCSVISQVGSRPRTLALRALQLHQERLVDLLTGRAGWQIAVGPLVSEQGETSLRLTIEQDGEEL